MCCALFLTLLLATLPAADTRIIKPDFSITLPGAWTEHPSQDGLDFVSPERGLQVNITVLTAIHPLEQAGLASATLKLLELRRRTLNKLADGKAEFVAVSDPIGPGASCRALAGVDRGHSIRFYTSIHGAPSKVVTVAFYKYSLVGSAEDFRLWAAKVLQSLTLSGT